MGIINIILVIITALFAIFPIIMIINRKEKSIIKQNTIQDCLKEYYKRYNNYQLIDLDTKLKPNEMYKMSSPFVIVLCIFIVILEFACKLIIPENRFISLLIISVVFILFAILFAFLLKGTTIQKMLLRNNRIELYDNSNNKSKEYELDKINIKYDILTGRYEHKSIYIYFNDDYYSSAAYNIYNFEPYIAFVIFINLLKRNELEKINNLNDDEIKSLQQNFIYSEE